MSIELKIKAKTLAEEARIIRLEKKKLKARARKAAKHNYTKHANRQWNQLNLLHVHDINTVRLEARATHLARAYIKDTPYLKVEQSCKQPTYRNTYVIPKAARMIQKYHDNKVTTEHVNNWINKSPHR